MARFIMSNRRAGKYTADAKLASRRSLDTSFEILEPRVRTLSDRAIGETSRRTIVLEAEPAEIETMRSQFGPDVMIEPEILHEKADDDGSFDLTRVATLDLSLALRGPAGRADFLGTGASTAVTVSGGGQPLVGAEVMLFLAGPGGIRERLEQRTDAAGETHFEYGTFYTVLGVIVSPHGGFWPQIVRGGGSRIDVTCRPLPLGNRFGWWHDIMNAQARAGAGIKVGVIDSGCGPHPALGHVQNLGAIVDGVEMPDVADGEDSGSHGSHVCGIVGARDFDGSDVYMGVAPDVELMSVRVFPPDRGANQGDIADAIDLLSAEHQADLINMSLGAPIGSQIERDAIIDAFQRGTLCICAAANSAGPVEFPAAFPETVAVAAVGRLGWVPSDAFPALPNSQDLFGSDQLYAADFTCFGSEVVCTAGGVGIISTVPERFGHTAPYAAMNGTSMASPAACGALAAMLSNDNAYLGMQRIDARANYAKSLLVSRCRSIGIPSDYQGHGVPLI